MLVVMSMTRNQGINHYRVNPTTVQPGTIEALKIMMRLDPPNAFIKAELYGADQRSELLLCTSTSWYIHQELI